MTQIRRRSSLDAVELLEKKRQELKNEKALLSAMRSSGRKDLETRFKAGEVYTATLARHVAQGGSASDPLTREQFKATIEGLLEAQEALEEMGDDNDSAKHYAKHVETLRPVLKPRELKAGKISFGRAVLITTGNHTRKDQRPARWIPIFIRRHEEAMKEITLELIGPGKQWLVDSVRHDSKYREFKAGDYLSLEEFAEMHWLNFQWFERGITTMEALIKAETSQKKSLGRAGGQSTKAPRRKAKKSRTKIA
jgi:hypothetical protein